MNKLMRLALCGILGAAIPAVARAAGSVPLSLDAGLSDAVREGKLDGGLLEHFFSGAALKGGRAATSVVRPAAYDPCFDSGIGCNDTGFKFKPSPREETPRQVQPREQPKNETKPDTQQRSGTKRPA